MDTLLISDLHLDASRPQTTVQFLEFLRGPARQAPRLLILGDLFEAWIGDDDPQPLADQVANALRELSSHGTRCAFMAGNRDFLLGPAYAQRCGMDLLDEPRRVELGGVPTLLMHGDTLCSDDRDYQAFRQTVRDPHWQQQFLTQTLEQRQAFAAQARARSSAHTLKASSEIMDVNQQLVEEVMREHGVTRLIHGHTHRPAVHHFSLDGRKAQRLVLGDWYEQASHLCIEPRGNATLRWSERSETAQA